MRKVLFGLFGLAALGLGAVAAEPAEAQPFYPGYGYGHHVRYERPVVVRRVDYRYPRRVYGVYRPYRPYPVYRPAYAGPRCVVRERRVWTGFHWAWRPVRVCRY